MRSLTAASLALCLFGCHDGGDCMTAGASSVLIAQAAVLHVDVYGEGAHCDGAGVQAGAAPAIASFDFGPGDTIRVDVPSGHRTLVLTAWADAAKTRLLGSGCTEADLAPGTPICLNLAVGTPDAAVDAAGDLAPPPPDLACHPADGGCASYGDCCGGLACCGGRCVDLATDPAHCGGCANGCAPFHATAVACVAATCVYTCEVGCGDCTASPPNLDGCETTLDTVDNCGACRASCDQVHAVGAACVNSACTYQACAPGRLDCNAAAPDLDGCECDTPACCGDACQTTHDNGLGASFYDCAPLATYNLVEAAAACAAFTGDPAQCTQVSFNGNRAAACSTGAARCICWGYSGPGVSGHVADSGTPQCTCPNGNQPAWK